MSTSVEAGDQAVSGICGDAMPHLSADQAAAWAGFMTTHAEIVRALDGGLASRYSLSLSALEVLTRVARASEGRVRMSDLAQQALLSQSRVSRIVDELEQRGLLRRASCPSDSRGVFAHITDAGRELTCQALEWHFDQIQERFFSRLDERQVSELGTIWRALGATEQSTGDCPGV